MWCDSCGHPKDVHGTKDLDPDEGCLVGDCTCGKFIRRYAS